MRGIAALTLVGALALPQVAQALTRAEAQRLRSQVQACWLAQSGSPTVTVRFSLDRKGRPDASSLRMVARSAGSKQAAAKAFDAAKRAILRCGKDGYSLPVEKYEKWRDIELTFNPERTISK